MEQLSAIAVYLRNAMVPHSVGYEDAEAELCFEGIMGAAVQAMESSVLVAVSTIVKITLLASAVTVSLKMDTPVLASPGMVSVRVDITVLTFPRTVNKPSN